MFTDFILVRHGETDYNKLLVIQGWIDVPLNPTGHHQAEITAQMLRNEHFDEVWYSDLRRASGTAAAIMKYHPGVPAYPCKQLREWKLGYIQNSSHAELEKELPEIEEMFQKEEIDIPVPGGESRTEFQNRIRKTFQDLADRSPGKRLLIVTHGGVLVRLYRLFGGAIPAGGKVRNPGNASVSRIRYDHESKKWSLVAWNQTYSSGQNTDGVPPAL